jgi:hypothetical protein
MNPTHCKHGTLDADIVELFDLVHIPEINKVFALKIEELKGSDLRQCIQDYQRKREMYYQDLFVTHYREGELYWFELTRYREWDWRMTKISPASLSYRSEYDILPWDVIDQIIDYPVNPDKVNTLEALHSDMLNKTVRLQFVRTSLKHIIGTVREKPGYLNVQGKKESISLNLLDENLEIAQQVFFHSLPKSPFLNDVFTQGNLASMMPAWLNQFNAGEKEQLSKDLSGDVNLYELINLVRVPEINKIFALKLKELKQGELKKCIENYQRKQAEYMKKLFTNRLQQEKEGGKEGKPRLYWVELSRYVGMDWGITAIIPGPPPHEPYFLLLPQDIINRITQITDFPINPDKVNTLESEVSELFDRWVDLEFVRSSSNYLFGTVRGSIVDEQQKNNGVRFSIENEVKMVYREFFSYLDRDPQLKEEFFKLYPESQPFMDEKDFGNGM